MILYYAKFSLCEHKRITHLNKKVLPACFQKKCTRTSVITIQTVNEVSKRHKSKLEEIIFHTVEC